MRVTISEVHKLSMLGAVALLAAGCSDSATGPDGSGDGYAHALVTDNPNSMNPSAAGPAFHVSGSAESASYNGTISGNMNVAISADGQVWYDLGSLNGIAVQAQSTGSGTNVHGEVQVPAGTYARVRLTMQGAKATIQAGAVIGGLTLTSDVEMQLGSGGTIVIEREVSTFAVSVDAAARTEIVFDLNSELWITAENVQQEEASEEEVESAGRADTRNRPRDTVQ